jgi:type I restriction enzyme S subunit
MKRGWETRKIGDIILENGKSTLKSKGNEVGCYPFFVSGFKIKSCDKSIIDGRNIFLPTGGNFYVHFYDGKASYSTDTWSLKTKDNIEIKYLYFYLLLNRDFINEKYFKGATIKHLQKKGFKEIPLSFPSLSEQQRIVFALEETLTSISKSKDNAERNLKNARELFESYLQNIFIKKGGNWEEKKINQISENLDSKRVPITKNVRNIGLVPYYGASGIVDYVADYIFNEDLLCVSEDGANLLARTYPIAFSISGKTWVNNHAHVLRFPSIVSQKFVELYLNSIKLDTFVSGMAQPKLNQTMLNKIPIPFPSIKEQEKLVNSSAALSNEIKKLETIYEQKLKNFEELRKSILQRAFNGEL